MKKITIILENNESTFTTMVDDKIAEKIFKDAVMAALKNREEEATGHSCRCKTSDECDCNSKPGPKRDDSIDARSIGEIFKKRIEEKRTEEKPKAWEIQPVTREPFISGGNQKPLSVTFDTPNKPTEHTPYKENRVSDPNKKYLCYYECRGCDKKFFKMASFGEEIKCSCGECSEISHMTQGIYECSCCGFKGFFKAVNGAQVSEVTCKGCDGPIDMKYHDDKKQWLSLNMFR